MYGYPIICFLLMMDYVNAMVSVIAPVDITKHDIIGAYTEQSLTSCNMRCGRNSSCEMVALTKPYAPGSPFTCYLLSGKSLAEIEVGKESKGMLAIKEATIYEDELERNGRKENCPPDTKEITRWSRFSPCSMSCGSGHQTRKRGCLKLANGKSDCGPSKERRICNTQPCAEVLISSETKIQFNKSVALLTELQKEFSISLEVFPSEFKNDGWYNVMHATISGNDDVYGARIPMVQFHHWKGANVLHISSAVSGNSNYNCFTTNAAVVQKWFSVVISQVRITNGYIYQVDVDGKQLCNESNAKPQVFRNVNVFVADEWHPTLSGTVKNFQISGASGVRLL